MKRLDIKTGFVCNNNCLFCAQADNRQSGNRPFNEIVMDLKESRRRCDGIVFTGGEVTIRKDFFNLVKLAKDLGYKNIQIQSNGRMFSSLKFCKDAMDAGATTFGIAIHGHNKRLHDSLTQANGSFAQTVKGIQNLKSLGAYVATNTVIVKQNCRYCEDIAILLSCLKVNQFQFAFVHPVGSADKNFDLVVPKISEAAKEMKKGLQIGINKGISVMTEGIPYCLMQGYEQCVGEVFIPETDIRGLNFQNVDDFSRRRKESEKMKFPQCKACKYYYKCEGPWKEYPEKRGNKEFKSVRNGQYLDNLRSFTETLKQIEAKKEIDLEDYRIIGRGGTHVVYEDKSDDSYVLKINKDIFKKSKEYLNLFEKYADSKDQCKIEIQQLYKDFVEEQNENYRKLSMHFGEQHCLAIRYLIKTVKDPESSQKMDSIVVIQEKSGLFKDDKRISLHCLPAVYGSSPVRSRHGYDTSSLKQISSLIRTDNDFCLAVRDFIFKFKIFYHKNSILLDLVGKDNVIFNKDKRWSYQIGSAIKCERKDLIIKGLALKNGNPEMLKTKRHLKRILNNAIRIKRLINYLERHLGLEAFDLQDE